MTHKEVEPSGLYYDSLYEKDYNNPPSVIFYI